MLNGSGMETVLQLFIKFPQYNDYIPNLMADPRMRIRLATTSIVEELVKVSPEHKKSISNAMLPLLSHSSHLVRGDAANLLAIAGGKMYLHKFRPLLNDPDPQVREVVQDILAEL